MKLILNLIVMIFATTASSSAIDCPKAKTVLEKFICSDAEMIKADDALNAAFSNRLSKTKDKAFRDALIKSQRRWLKNRTPDGKIWAAGADEENETDNKPGPKTKTFIIDTSAERTRFFESGEAIATLEAQRALHTKDGNGAYGGYRTDCWFVEPPWGAENSYVCVGTVRRQKANRICAATQEWTSGHTTEVRTVGTVLNSKLVPVATCKYGYSGLKCPGEFESEADARWTLNPKKLEDGELDEAGFWKYDPDAFSDSPEWLDECISSSIYPPVEQLQR